jgi:hypothetical protein
VKKVGATAKQINVPGETCSQQSAIDRISPIWDLAGQQDLCSEDAPIDLVGTRQRLWTRKVGRTQEPLRIPGGRDSGDVGRWAVNLDHHRSPVVQLDPPNGVDAPGAETDLRYGATKSIQAYALRNDCNSDTDPVPCTARSVSVVLSAESLPSDEKVPLGVSIIEASHGAT